MTFFLSLLSSMTTRFCGRHYLAGFVGIAKLCRLGAEIWAKWKESVDSSNLYIRSMVLHMMPVDLYTCTITTPLAPFSDFWKIHTHLIAKVANQSQPQALWKIHPILIQGCKFFMGNTRCNSALGVKPCRRWANQTQSETNCGYIKKTKFHWNSCNSLRELTIIIQIIQTNITYHLSTHSKYVCMAKQNLLLKINAFYKAQFVWSWSHRG